MDEIWERAVETALDGQTDCASARSLTLDGVVKCCQGRLPPPNLLEKFQNLEHLSMASVGVSSLENFPRLQNLQKLILSDNRIAGGLEFLVEAGLESLRYLDLSNNKIQDIEDLAPLAQLKLVSLDLYECPVTRIKDYRSRVFGLIRSLKYLDKMDADENESPESEEEEDDDDEEEEEEEEDPESGEVDGEDQKGKMVNGGSSGGEGILDVDEDDESDTDEEEMRTEEVANGSKRPLQQVNGFHVSASSRDEEDAEDEDDDDDLGEEIDEEEGEEEDVVEVHEIEDSDDDEGEDEDGVEMDDGIEEEEDEEEVEDEEEDVEPRSTGRLTSTEGEIDGHEHGEDDETGEEPGVEEDEAYVDDDGEDEVRFTSSYKINTFFFTDMLI